MLTIPEAAKEIGMSRVVLWRHVKADHIKTERAGKYTLIDSEELERFRRQERKPGRPPDTPTRPR